MEQETSRWCTAIGMDIVQPREPGFLIVVWKHAPCLEIPAGIGTDFQQSSVQNIQAFFSEEIVDLLVGASRHEIYSFLTREMGRSVWPTHIFFHGPQ